MIVLNRSRSLLVLIPYSHTYTTDSQFMNILEDYIRDRGAMSQLISDSAQVEISKLVLYILRALCIGDW